MQRARVLLCCMAVWSFYAVGHAQKSDSHTLTIRVVQSNQIQFKNMDQDQGEASLETSRTESQRASLHWKTDRSPKQVTVGSRYIGQFRSAISQTNESLRRFLITSSESTGYMLLQRPDVISTFSKNQDSSSRVVYTITDVF